MGLALDNWKPSPLQASDTDRENHHSAPEERHAPENCEKCERSGGALEHFRWGDPVNAPGDAPLRKQRAVSLFAKKAPLPLSLF